MIEATGAQIVVKLLERQGIETVSGIPGGSILPLYDELARSSIRHVLVRHEQGGGFIAQGMSRSTGKTAVCLATSGPGAMNLLTAIADARSDSIPLVAITGQVNTYLIGTDAFQEADTFGLSFPITKHSVMVNSAAELLEAIPRAFALAAEGRPGPVLVDIPRDIQLQTARFEAWPEPGVPVRGAARFRAEAEEFADAIDRAARALLESSRPVLYAGGGCNSRDGADGIARLRESFRLPVVTSLMGIGAVASRDPEVAGMVGMHGSVAANRAMHDSDLVLAVGVRFDDRATGLIKRFCPDARIIHIDIDAAEVNKILPAAISLVGDAESALPALAARIDELASGAIAPAGASVPASADGKPAITPNPAAAKARSRDRAEWLGTIGAMKAEAEAERERLPGIGTGDYPHPGAVISSIPSYADKAGSDGGTIIVTTDVGQHQMWAAQYYPVNGPRRFLTSGSLGTMGFGLPVAIGAAIANPGTRVVCISGDGSIMMNVQELATLAELGLDVTVLVFDNGALGMVRQQQDFIFKKNFSASIFERAPDLIRIAEGFGIVAVSAEEPGWETVAFGGSGPRFVRCPIRQDEMVYPFVPAGRANVEAITGAPVFENA